MGIDKLSKVFKGEVLTDEETLRSVSTDFGRLLIRRPSALAVPKDIADVQSLILFANEEGMQVSIRGAAHSQGGQSLGQEVILLDMLGLSSIGKIEDDAVWVDAGALWIDVVEETVPRGFIPPVLTNCLHVTVGGTISLGGIGVASHVHGVQADNVLAMEVVTGVGDIVRCSRTENADLFNCVRCSLGQFAVICRVQLKLRRCKPNVRTYYLLYDDFEKLMLDQRKMIDHQQFDFLEGWSVPCTQGLRTLGETRVSFAEWFYPFHVTVEYGESPPPDSVVSGLQYYRKVHVEDSGIYDFLRRMEPVFQTWREAGSWTLAHPWMETFLPWERAAEYIQGVLKSFPPHLLAGGQVLFWPCLNSNEELPLLARPAGTHVIGFGILPAVQRHQVGMTISLLNRASDLVMQVSGKRYLSGWVEFDEDRWRAHFGSNWDQILNWKNFFDPNRVLNASFVVLPHLR